MKKNRKMCLSLTVFVLAVAFCGCGQSGTAGQQETNEPVQMPDIVFMNTISYADISGDGEHDCAMTFYDKNGDHYVSHDKYVCTLSFEKLVEEYAADSRIRFVLHSSLESGADEEWGSFVIDGKN